MERTITRTVFKLSLVSLFTDTASEMLYLYNSHFAKIGLTSVNSNLQLP